ncbi:MULTISPECIES: phosphonate ABC transporter ATP-binding protein [unclassified Sporolactobacillus]|uniref:phosphonate ABC transporter ATP-binding protein n=1 Tax=unclassified Sporolactobacillus TaxID=2628533 RepID=UPI002367D9A0|nr:phosphonate ABC transporter ATP-binding protein [Sporolactobacillus sp. CQH2019]MDD9150027.1 phosphonate ABC transporter ATP-binding protein [Sporolactobacillus sp. CQH2019]
MATLLEFRDVSKRYDKDTLALSHVSFSVNEGELVSIIGPSGAGKSTLLRCINRLVEATSGEIIFDKTNVQQLKKGKLRTLRTKIGMIFQNYNLVDRLSVFENVLHGRLGYKSSFTGALGIYHEDEKRHALEILKSLGLEEQVYKRCDQLSGGQKQRVGIARALVQEPRVLLADEPIASLDPSSSKTIMDHLRNISTSLGITVLVNLHQLDIALNYADRIIGISQGKVVYDGLPEEITDEKIRAIYGADSEELDISISKFKEVAQKR